MDLMKIFFKWSVPVLLGLVFFQSPPVFSEDWPQWLGARRDGVWRETGVLSKFPEGGPRVLWRQSVNHGYSGPSVSGDRVYVMDRRIVDPSKVPKNAFERGMIPGNERVLCLDAKTGNVLWEHDYPCDYTVSYAAGPRVTPAVDSGRVYTVGAEGDLLCLDAANGDVLWKHDFKARYGIKAPVWGFAGSPLVEGDLVYCLAGGDGTTAVAFDKVTGEQKWAALSAKEPGYCPPKIVRHAGRKLLIIWHPESVNALDPLTGEVYWTVPWSLRSGLSIPTPQIVDDRLLLVSFYNGSTMLKLEEDNATPEILWQTERASEKRTTHLHGIMSTPVFTSSHLYGVCSYGEFRCLETASGARIWESLAPIGLEKPVRWGNVFITPHKESGRCFLFTEKGDLVIAALNPQGYREMDRARVIKPDNIDLRQREVVWSHPAYAHKCCFVRNDSEILCLSLAGEG